MEAVFALALWIVRPDAVVTDGIPQGASVVERLSTKKLRHHEVLRIRRDFGMEHWEIVLDGWLSRGAAGHIADVRLWWANTDDADRRKPFSAYLRRYIAFEHRRADTGALVVRMAGDHKEYAFTVELDDVGAPKVYADVELADGSTVAHCRCAHGRLVARRVLGIPVGIAALEVRCTDARGQAHDGVVPHRALAGGATYVPEPG